MRDQLSSWVEKCGYRPAPDRRSEHRGFGRTFRRVFTFDRLEVVSLTHSAIYFALLVSAFALGGPQPYTFILGLSHGLIWIAMSVISSTYRFVLSPGITISTPSSRFTAPVTSVVRKKNCGR